MIDKVLKVGKALTKENNIANGGGLSSLLMPRHLNLAGGIVVTTGVTALAVGNAGLKSHNVKKLGRVSYMDGPARMTKSYTTGAIPAMMNASGGNYEVFNDMAEEVVRGHNNPIGTVLDDYGANAEFVKAIYGMGGR